MSKKNEETETIIPPLNIGGEVVQNRTGHNPPPLNDPEPDLPPPPKNEE